jgi:uncharacterized protein YcbK (DUF882 family)
MLQLRRYIPGRRISLHFLEDEFKCPCCGMILVNPVLIKQLEGLRYELGNRPIIVTSGYRCFNHNNSLKNSSPRSQHMYGNAADIFVSSLSPSEIASHAEKFFDGIGIYNGFIHVDVRGYKARWKF